MAHDWNDFDRFESKYMPDYGDGDTMASQAETALNKLVYKWYNDGDVYDNQHGMAGWANDISGSANWLANHFPGAKAILDRIIHYFSPFRLSHQPALSGVSVSIFNSWAT